MLLIDLLPELATELQQLLERRGRHDLVGQVPKLQIVERCRCEDGFCSSFYTQPKPQGAYGTGHENIDLDVDDGMVVLDVVAGVICHVEILNRANVRKKLLAAIP